MAYISRPDNTECSGDLTTLPDGYTVYLVNTSSDNIEVFGLIPGTCYAFGVRVYTSISDSPGEFTVKHREPLFLKVTFLLLLIQRSMNLFYNEPLIFSLSVVSRVTSEGQQATSRTSVQLSWSSEIYQTTTLHSD